MTTVLEVTRLAVRYGGKVAVSELTLNVAEGELVTVIGHNGAGKSSLLSAIHGQVPADGTIRYLGEEVQRWSPERRLAAGMALVPQGHQVFGPLTVKENLLIAGLAVGKDRPSDLTRVYALFPILEERSYQRASTLSGGQQQMLAIGMGMIVEPRLLLVDEPSIGLAPTLVSRVMQALKTVRDEHGCAVLLVEQNIEQSFAVADRVYGMRRGAIVADGHPDTFARDHDLMEIM